MSVTTRPLSKWGVIDRLRDYFENHEFGIEKLPEGSYSEFRCVYRGGNDPASPVRCAVGCLIPDELYASKLKEYEGLAGSAVIPPIRDALVEAGVIDEEVDARLLRTLQGQHDHFATRVAKGKMTLEEAQREFVSRLNLIEELVA